MKTSIYNIWRFRWWEVFTRMNSDVQLYQWRGEFTTIFHENCRISDQTTWISYQYKPQFHENDVGSISSNFGLLVPSCSIPSMALPFLSQRRNRTSVAGSDARAKSHSKDARPSQESQEAPGSCWKWQFSDFRLLNPLNIGKLIRLGNHPLSKLEGATQTSALMIFATVWLFFPLTKTVCWFITELCGKPVVFGGFYSQQNGVVFAVVLHESFLLGIQEFGVAKTDRNL